MVGGCHHPRSLARAQLQTKQLLNLLVPPSLVTDAVAIQRRPLASCSFGAFGRNDPQVGFLTRQIVSQVTKKRVTGAGCRLRSLGQKLTRVAVV